MTGELFLELTCGPTQADFGRGARKCNTRKAFVLVSIDPRTSKRASPGLHRIRGAPSLYVVARHFGLLCGASIPRFHLWPLGKARDRVLVQASPQETRTHRILPKKQSLR